MENVITLTKDGYIAEIVPSRGANCIRFACPREGIEVLRTPDSIDDFKTKNPYLYGMPILFLPNRISDGRFFFEGRKYSFPVNEPSTGCHLHGMLHQTPFRAVKQEPHRAVFEYKAAQEQPYLNFPHAFTLQTIYEVSKGGLDQRVLVRNDSKLNMPVALAFHTTFNVPFAKGSKSEDVRLTLSVGREYVRKMENFLPTGEVLDDHPLKKDLTSGGIIPCEHTISRHYEQAEGHRMEMKDLKKGVTLIYEADENYRYWMLWNGGNRDFICVEPQTWLCNAPNAPFPRNETGFDYLEPGEERQYHTRLYFKDSCS